MNKFLDKKYSSLIPYTPGEQPAGMEKLIKLNTNESPFSPSEKVKEVINSEAIDRLNLYSDPDSKALNRAIASYYGLTPEQVFTCNGSDEALAFVFAGMCENGAVFNDITYGFYKVFADLFGVKKDIVPLREDFSIAVTDYKGKKSTVFIANPNAPTGMTLSSDEIEKILGEDLSRLVVIDEAYVDFGGESVLPLLKNYNNLLLIRTFSKSRSLAGARLGYALGNEEVIKALNTIKFSFNPYNVNSLTALAGIAAIEDEEYFESCTKAIAENREFTSESLKALGFKVLPSTANFIFASPVPMMGGREYFSKLREKGILVRHWDTDRISQYVRISIGTEEQMKRLIEATEEILKGE